MLRSTFFSRLKIGSTLFLLLAPIFSIVFVPLELARSGFQWEIWAVAFGLWVVTGMSIGGYHRLFSHRAYEAPAWVRAFFLFFATGSVQNSALVWSADHRYHHAFTDTDRDPYNIKRGFFYAHIGWILLKTDPKSVAPHPKDLLDDPLVMWQHRYYVPLMLTLAFGVPTFLGWLLVGNPWGGFVIAGVARVVVVHHFVFLVNSAAHWFGTQPYSERTSARDSWWLAFLTFGEGYHNYHHSFEYDYRNGVRWYQWDPNKWLILALAWTGQAKGLRRASDKTIHSAHMRMEELRLQRRGVETGRLAELKAQIEAYHDKMRVLLEQYRTSRLVPLKAELHATRREMRRAWQEWKRSRRALASSA